MKHSVSALLILLVAVFARSNTGEIKTLTVLYTASAQGQVRTCNCTKFKSGGYGRQLTLLKSIRSECTDYVLIEGGDMVAWTGFTAPLKTELAVKAMKLLEYHAIVPGENEIGKPGDRPIDKFDGKTPPLVCANYVSSQDHGGKPSGSFSGPGHLSRKSSTSHQTIKPYVVVKTRSGIRVGIIGLLSKSASRLFQEEDFNQLVQDPVLVLRRLAPKVRRECDFLIVVYHGPVGEAQELAFVKGINLVLATHRLGRDVPLPCQPLNEVEVPVKMVGRVPLVGSLTHENWSVGRIDIDLKTDGSVVSAKHKLIYLDRRYVEDSALIAVYDEYSRKVKDAVLSFSEEFQSKGESMLTKRGLNLVEMRKRLRKSQLATAERCKSCHESIHDGWLKTRHAKAMATLAKTNQEYDPECITCHATGVLVRNGFANMRDTPELANVQCEACHGPGLAHAESPSKGYGETGEEICRSCHTDDRTPEFDYEKEWAKIKH
ncbi:MAG: hypothetical protein N3B12_06325 [Armatimonadetes bacterium]|nr:hypothetical protein [Armatimonadota bacterium]